MVKPIKTVKQEKSRKKVHEPLVIPAEPLILTFDINVRGRFSRIVDDDDEMMKSVDLTDVMFEVKGRIHVMDDKTKLNDLDTMQATWMGKNPSWLLDIAEYGAKRFSRDLFDVRCPITKYYKIGVVDAEFILKIVLAVDESSNIAGFSICAPCDHFDKRYGKRLATKRLAVGLTIIEGVTSKKTNIAGRIEKYNNLSEDDKKKFKTVRRQIVDDGFMYDVEGIITDGCSKINTIKISV